ncbi:MAG: aminotransferase class V-fold PLP-dependent enzyme [Burkholderiales bacterium]|nr:aminotransferase class V-fold PLP-dependent enzyme [Burkholderiales bacterium]
MMPKPSFLLPTYDTPLGHRLRSLWSLDPSIHFLNHGSYGATPRFVQAAQLRWREELENEPVRFIGDILPDALRVAGARLARFVGTSPPRLALVENATAGVTAVLRSIRWNAGDRIVLANHAYPAVKNTARYLAERYGLHVIEAQVPWPLTSAEALVEAYTAAIEGGARIAIIDHIFSPLAVVTPLGAIVRLCRERGVQVLVDGAHAPGMLRLSLDALGDMGVDWYVGNCHKWLCAPKGCGFIVATPEGQRDLHPAVISNFYGEGFEKEFAWTGTIDPSARLAITAALEFIEAIGLERYHTALRAQAREASAMLANAWGVVPGAPAEMFAAMVTLPLPVNEPGSKEAVARWRLKLLQEHNIEVPVHAINGRLWVRISAQVYNELSDYEALAQVFA